MPMSLQRRLTVFFTVIVILPVATAGVFVQQWVTDELQRRAEFALPPALGSTVVLYNDRVKAVDERVRAAVESRRFARLLRTGRPLRVEAFLNRRVARLPGLDFLVALDRRAKPLAFGHTEPSFAPGVEVPGAAAILAAADGIGRGFARSPEIPVRASDAGRVGAVVGGFWLDDELVGPAATENVQLAVVVDGTIVAATTPLERPVRPPLDFDGSFRLELGQPYTAQASALTGGASVVAFTPLAPIDDRARLVWVSMVGLLVIATIATALVANILARSVTQPLEELTKGALAISEGRLDHRIAVDSRDEVGQLASVFNDMTERLEATITELQGSRDQLQRAVIRVGEALRSTHDMRQILEAILRTAGDAVATDAATFWTFSPTRDELYPAIAIGADVDSADRVKVGRGVVGLVGERGITVTLPHDRGGPRPAAQEPQFPVVLALPMYSADRIYGVVALYRADEARPFAREDVETVEFLAQQGSVALENVSLHEEANRLSLTDGLTGVYNRRYYQMQFRQALANAGRFQRPFSVLMMDLDHFKKVNDTHGHQRGDAILIEFAQRVTRTLREVDTFARYGGEEFICLLSETGVQGAITTAEKIVEVVRSEPFGGVGEAPVDLSVSVGVASWPEHGDSYRSLVEAADVALYRAKQEGRNRVCVAGTPPDLKVAK